MMAEQKTILPGGDVDKDGNFAVQDQPALKPESGDRQQPLKDRAEAVKTAGGEDVGVVSNEEVVVEKREGTNSLSGKVEDFKKWLLELEQEDDESLLEVIEAYRVRIEGLENELNTQDLSKAEAEASQLENELVDQLWRDRGSERHMRQQAQVIRGLATSTGLTEGTDFLVIDNPGAVTSDSLPHENKELFIAVADDKYETFKELFDSGQYEQQLKSTHFKGPSNERVGIKYSWAGRFFAYGIGEAVDVMPVVVEEGKMNLDNLGGITVNTRHSEFKAKFKDRTNIDFPSAVQLNDTLLDVSRNGIDRYKEALEKMKILANNIPSNAPEGMPEKVSKELDNLVRAVVILEDSANGKGVVELPEQFSGVMPDKVRQYCDLTYNADSLINLDTVEELTGVKFPDDIRIDKIFKNLGLDNYDDINATSGILRTQSIIA